MSKADTALNEPYQAYTGPRGAGTTADQTSAYNLTRANTNAFQPMIQQGGQYLTGAGQAVNSSDIDQYMNPYNSAVTDRLAQLGQRNLTENLLPNVNATFLAAGQGIGGSRNTDFTLRALRDANESILGQQAGVLQQGYTTALGAAQQQKTNQLNAGTQLGNLASTGQSVGLKDAAALQAYIKKVSERVGWLAAGWRTAAEQLGINLPQWIARHKSPGSMRIEITDTGLEITMTNAVGYASEVKDMTRRVQFAVDGQAAAMTRRSADYMVNMLRRNKLITHAFA